MPEGMPNHIVKGLNGIAAKSREFESQIEKIHKSIVSDPIVAENFFFIAMLLNVDMKGVPTPIDMDEICLYTVRDGKIVLVYHDATIRLTTNPQFLQRCWPSLMHYERATL